MLNRSLVVILILAFSATVTCAAVCGQQAGEGKKHEDGSRCDECVSTAFVSATKVVDEGLVPITLGEFRDGCSVSVLYVQPLVPQFQLTSGSPPSVASPSDTLRI